MTIKTQLAIYLILPVLFAACKTIDPTPIIKFSGIKLKKLATYENENIYTPKPQFAADGTIAVAVSGTGFLFLDPNTGKEATKISSVGTNRGVHLSNNGLALVVFSRSTQLWDLNKNEKLMEWSKSVKFAESALSKNGQYAIVDEQLWDVTTKQTLGRVVLAENTARTVISPDNQYIVSVGFDVTISRFSDLQGYKDLGVDGFALNAWFSIDHQKVFVIYGARRHPISTFPIPSHIAVFQLDSMTKIDDIENPGPITSLAISQKTGDILTSSENGSITLWKNNDYSLVQSWQIENPISDSAADTEGKIWLASNHGEIYLFEPDSNSVTHVGDLTNGIITLTLSDKQKLLVAHLFYKTNGQYNRLLEIYQIK